MTLALDNHFLQTQREQRAFNSDMHKALASYITVISNKHIVRWQQYHKT